MRNEIADRPSYKKNQLILFIFPEQRFLKRQQKKEVKLKLTHTYMYK